MATLSDLYGHLKTLVEQWVYNKTQMNTRLDGGTEGNVTFAGKVDKESGKGLSSNDYTTTEKNKLAGIEAQANKITVDSALSSTSTNPLENKAINTALSNKISKSQTSGLVKNDGTIDTTTYLSSLPSHTHDDLNIDISHPTDLTNIASLAGVSTSTIDTQKKLNDCIDQAFAQVSSIKALEVVSTLPTASSSTMGLLYIINENSKINFYYTEYDEDHQTYDWHKMDTDILDELIINWSDVQNKPSSFTPASHAHGNLLNGGTITQTVTNGGNLVVTNSSNAVGVQSAIDVLDGVVNQLITYGSS